MFPIRITSLEGTFESHLAVGIIGDPFPYLMIVAVFSLKGLIAGFFFPFSGLHAVEIGPFDDDVAFFVILHIITFRKVIKKVFLFLDLSRWIVPSPGAIQLSILVFSHLFEHFAWIIELPFPGAFTVDEETFRP